jgi:protein SCO1/2
MNKKLNRLFLILAISLSAMSFSQSAFSFELEKATDEWTDESGQKFTIASLKGKNVAITMAYSECKKTCPMLTIQTLKDVSALYKKNGSSIELVVASLDPEHDKPAVLKAFKEKKNMDSQWHLLVGSEKITRKLAQDIGFGDYWTMDDHILHGFTMLILDETGKVVKTLDWEHRELDGLFKDKPL